MNTCRILMPCGSMGAGINPEGFENGMAMKSRAVAVDDGSTDSGLAYLANGMCKYPKGIMESDFKIALAGKLLCAKNLISRSKSSKPLYCKARGMVVTLLGRLADIDIADYSGADFNDVDTSQYYAPYVKWAAEKGIVKGVGEGNFAPDANISRQDLEAILYRYAEVMGIILPETETAAEFGDFGNIAGCAAAAVTAMQKAGIINGKPGNVFDPTGIATCDEVAAMLHRFV